MFVAFRPGRLWLIDREFDKLLVVNPVVLGDQVFAQVRHHPAEAGGADDEELEEDVEDRGLGPGRGHQCLSRLRDYGYVHSWLCGALPFRRYTMPVLVTPKASQSFTSFCRMM